MSFSDALLYIIQGIIIATVIDVVGSIASRKFNFKNTYLAPLSLLNYSTVGYFTSDGYGLKAALVASFIVGVYDALVGVWIVRKLKANYDFSEEDEKFADHPFSILFLVAVAVVSGLDGHLFV